MSGFNRFSLKKHSIANLVLVLLTILLTACGGISPFGAKPTNTLEAASPVTSASKPVNAAQGDGVQQAMVPLTGKGQVFRVDISDNAFTSAELFIPAGATVLWTNTGQHAHSVTSDDGSFDSGNLQSGQTYEHEFDQVGTVVYHCSIHGSADGHGMSGAITIVTSTASGAEPAAAMSSAGMQMANAASANTASANAGDANANAAPSTVAGVAAAQGSAAGSGAQPAAQSGTQRVFYIAAVEVEWDYAPQGKNMITGEPFGDVENVFVEHASNRIGKVYTKAVYREFTDDTFNQQKPIPPEWQHLGIMGPTIHAEVGDEIIVHYMNKTTIPTSMHPHGVLYKKDSEGAGYSDGTSGTDKDDDAVPPGGTHTYTWEVPERAGPGPNDPRSIMWMYHSHVDEPGDTNAGLLGAIIVSARGNANPDGTPKDVDREFVITFSVMDENSSVYLLHNIQTKISNPSSINPDDEEFHESNLMHSINGYVYGNLPGLVMKKGERVRWYVMGMGTEVDLHTPHWHGNVVSFMGMNMDVIELLPASMKVVDMLPDNPGTWLLHCHVNDHIVAGMQATYKVEE